MEIKRKIDKNKHKSLIIIVFFFGNLPWYYPYFLHSCIYNPTIDFLIVTDNNLTDKLPKNIYWLKKSKEEIKKLTSHKLKCNITLDPQPYKFCDFRPAFGTIFQDYIKDYDFWGHGDLDVIFGKIRHFITDKLMDQYDIISMRHSYISSWFTLYRNCMRINKLFSMSRDYEKVFTTPKYYNFDETNFTFMEFFDGLPYQQINSEIESMTHLVKRLHNENYIRAYFDLHAIERVTGNIKWDKGHFIYKNEYEYEFMLYHLKHFKRIYNPAIKPKKVPDFFRISQSRIYF